MLKKILLLLLAIVGLLAVVVLFNTFTFKSRQIEVAHTPAPPADTSSIRHLQEAIQIKTVSFTDTTQIDTTQFRAFHSFLAKTYPLVHQKMELVRLAGNSLLYKWPGSDDKLNPYVLMAHQDVVPIEEASRGSWTVDPFAGTVKDNFIWGRGSTDDKINLIGIMEAAEKLLKEKFQPQRTVYLAFGHDEEIGGKGARAITTYLKAKGVTADLVLDEGGIVTRDKVPGMTKPVALIGTSEKGYLSLDLTVNKHGGHSSMPEKETALDILIEALSKLHEHPFDANFSPSTEGFISHVGPEMPFGQRLVFANTWLFKSLVISIYEQSAGGNAIVRTTMVPTILHAGVKDNVVPSQAKATVNLRLLPGDDSESVITKLKEIIHDDRVEITRMGDFTAEASAISPEDGPGYKLVDETVHKIFEGTVTTPFMMIGGTDSRLMEPISKNIIKFSPMIDPIGFHGIDERVSIQSYADTIWFFELILRKSIE